MAKTEEEKREANRIACAKWKAKKALTDPSYEVERQAKYHRENKEARNEKAKMWADKNRARFNELCNKAYHKFKHNKQAPWNSPENKLYQGAKKRSTKSGREFDITLEDIVIPEVCPVLGISIIPKENVADGTHIQDHSPFLDRIDNTKGYVKGNVQVISYRANRLKGHGSLEELRRVVDYLESKLPL